MMSSKIKLTAFAVSAILLASCSNDEIQEINEGTALTFTTGVSRATETSLENLDHFRVYADAVGYRGLFIDGIYASKSDGNYYTLPQNYYWPSDVATIKFWAYGPTGETADEKGGIDFDISPSISADGQKFSTYTPAKSLTEGGLKQKDFVVAYNKVNRTEATGMTVHLNFHHALSQVVVNAKHGDDPTKRVYVKGAWIVNAKDAGTLSFNDETEGLTNYMLWTSQETLGAYGVVLSKETELSASVSTLIGGTDNSSLMLIPQATDGVEFTDGNADNGAYILVLCRVEAIHDGTDHPGSSVIAENGKHVHQLFPVNAENTFNKDEYGYTCVPLNIDWVPGKKYVYTLEFCGKKSGAGVYPPKPGTDYPTENVVDRPDGKGEGDLVLDDPIKFYVEVDDWTPAEETLPVK